MVILCIKHELHVSRNFAYCDVAHNFSCGAVLSVSGRCFSVSILVWGILAHVSARLSAYGSVSVRRFLFDVISELCTAIHGAAGHYRNTKVSVVAYMYVLRYAAAVNHCSIT